MIQLPAQILFNDHCLWQIKRWYKVSDLVYRKQSYSGHLWSRAFLNDGMARWNYTISPAHLYIDMTIKPNNSLKKIDILEKYRFLYMNFSKIK